MKTAPLPANEDERLAALARYHVLDTSAEAAFDELTELAAQTCDTPIGMITFIDRDRQWFKSRYGWEVTETPRRISFCAHTIVGKDPMIVSDLRADDRFADNPLVKEGPRIRFYAGVPLATAEGHNLGTLSVMNPEPGSITPAQIRALRILARQVMTQLELRLRLVELARTAEEYKRTERRLQETEAFYRALVESLPQNIIRKDVHGKFTFANRKFCETIGIKPDELIGKTDFDLYPQELAGKYHRDDLRVMATQQNLDTVEAHQTAHGEKGFVHVIKAPLYDARGQVVGIQGIFWDVTQRKRIEEALAYERDLLRALLDNIPDRIYFKDVHSRFLRCSASMIKRLGLGSAREIVGKTDFDFHRQDLAQEYYNDEQRIILTGHPLINKLEKQRDLDGGEIWASVTKVPTYNQNLAITGIIGISRDVTQLKRAEQELEQARDDALKSANAKSQFLANMSHEIRTPMNAITGMTGLLQHTALDVEQLEYVETIRDSTTTLLAIINDILDFSKIEAGKIDLERIDFDLRQAVESTTKMLANNAQSKGLELGCWIEQDVPTLLRGDPGRFRQVLANLVSNAVKFTEQGEVIVRISLAEENANKATLHVSVKDTGIGIDLGAFPQIFDAFTQADGSTTRKFGGTGLGLTISKHLVELMQGQIGVDSQIDHGSNFWFEIPFDKQPIAQRNAPSTIREQLAGKRVLVVDDSASNRQILLGHLNSWNIECREAATHREALMLLQEAAHENRAFDMALIDMEMPEGNGALLAENIKSQPTTADCRLIALTTLRATASVAEMKAAGILGRLIKPIRQSHLADCLMRSAAPNPEPAFESSGNTQITPPKQDKSPIQAQTVRILLAEDNPVNQRVALSQLNKLGFRADAVLNGQQVLDAMKERDYDIILMDCQMPEMDGYEASRQLRARGDVNPPDSHRPYIIALTANTLAGDRERCMEAGMNDYLSKPIDINHLQKILNRALPRLNRPTKANADPAPAPADHRPKADADPITDLPTLDTSVIRELRSVQSGTDPNPMADLIELYRTDSQKRLQNIKEGLDNRDAQTVAHAAHSLKGSSNNLGACRLGEYCRLMEKEAKAGNLDAAASYWPALDEEYHAVLAHLQQELQT